MGRPKLPAGQAKDSSLIVRLTDEDRLKVEAAAQASGQPLSDWARARLLDPKPFECTWQDGPINIKIMMPDSAENWERLIKFVQAMTPSKTPSAAQRQE